MVVAFCGRDEIVCALYCDFVLLLENCFIHFIAASAVLVSTQGATIESTINKQKNDNYASGNHCCLFLVLDTVLCGQNIASVWCKKFSPKKCVGTRHFSMARRKQHL